MAAELIGVRPERLPARWYRRALAVLLLAAFALRVAVRAATGPADFYAHGYSFYLASAAALASGRGYLNDWGTPAVERPPLYPLFVALLNGHRDFWPLLIAQALVGTATVACIAMLARQFAGHRAALIAAGIAAFYPYYVRHDTALQETALLTLLGALATLLLLHARRSGALRDAAAGGVMLGLAALARPTIAPMLLLGPLWLFASPSATSGRRAAARNAALAPLLGLAMLAPWLMRQHAVLGTWALSSDAGRGLYAGNNDATFAVYPRGSIDESQRIAMARIAAERIARFGTGTPVSRPDVQAWLHGKAIGWIRTHPVDAALGAVRKNLAAFGVLPSPRIGWIGDVVHALSYGPVLALALAGAWRLRRDRRLLLIAAQFAAFVGVTALFWGHTNHRAFLDVYLIALAAVALAKFWESRTQAANG